MNPATQDGKRAPHEFLSAREYQIFYKLGQGEDVTRIAGELCLSIKTISTYRSIVLGKMKMSCNTDIICYAINGKLID